MPETSNRVSIPRLIMSTLRRITAAVNPLIFYDDIRPSFQYVVINCELTPFIKIDPLSLTS